MTFVLCLLRRCGEKGVVRFELGDVPGECLKVFGGDGEERAQFKGGGGEGCGGGGCWGEGEHPYLYLMTVRDTVFDNEQSF